MATIRDNSILVGEYIQIFLESDSDLVGITGTDGIFSLQQPNKLNFPFVMYQRNIYPEYAKAYPMSGWTNNVQVEIVCVSNKYVQSVEIANIVRACLEWRHYEDEKIKIHPIELQSVHEYVVDTDSQTAYVQSLLFDITVE